MSGMSESREAVTARQGTRGKYGWPLTDGEIFSLGLPKVTYKPGLWIHVEYPDAPMKCFAGIDPLVEWLHNRSSNSRQGELGVHTL